MWIHNRIKFHTQNLWYQELQLKERKRKTITISKILNSNLCPCVTDRHCWFHSLAADLTYCCGTIDKPVCTYGGVFPHLHASLPVGSRFLRFSCAAIPAVPLKTSMAAESFWSMDLCTDTNPLSSVRHSVRSNSDSSLDLLFRAQIHNQNYTYTFVVVRKKHWMIEWNWFLTVYSDFSFGSNFSNTMGLFYLSTLQ